MIDNLCIYVSFIAALDGRLLFPTKQRLLLQKRCVHFFSDLAAFLLSFSLTTHNHFAAQFLVSPYILLPNNNYLYFRK